MDASQDRKHSRTFLFVGACDLSAFEPARGSRDEQKDQLHIEDPEKHEQSTDYPVLLQAPNDLDCGQCAGVLLGCFVSGARGLRSNESPCPLDQS